MKMYPLLMQMGLFEVMHCLNFDGLGHSGMMLVMTSRLSNLNSCQLPIIHL